MPVMNTRTLLASLSVLLGLAVGVKGYEQAVCPAGWEWVRTILSLPGRGEGFPLGYLRREQGDLG